MASIRGLYAEAFWKAGTVAISDFNTRTTVPTPIRMCVAIFSIAHPVSRSRSTSPLSKILWFSGISANVISEDACQPRVSYSAISQGIRLQFTGRDLVGRTSDDQVGGECTHGDHAPTWLSDSAKVHLADLPDKLRSNLKARSLNGKSQG
jgi:hypothetical protein